MSAITTHILDLAGGRPARGVDVTLARADTEGWQELAVRQTDADGRVGDLLDEDAPLVAGTYRLRFAVGEAAARRGEESFFPYADVVFAVRDADAHYHVPLLLSPFGYSTYRGS